MVFQPGECYKIAILSSLDYMKELESSYVNLDHRVKQDFNTSYSEFVTQKNPLSWREFIQSLNEAKLKT